MHRLPLLQAFALAFALAGAAPAQDAAVDSVKESQVDRVPSPANPGAVIFSRDRALMHPGDPLDVTGLEQGGNSFRGRAPALFASDREPLLVDREENRRRRLAMYAEGAVFPTALSPPDPAAARRRSAPAAGPPRGAQLPSSARGSECWLWVPATVVLGLLLGYWYRHQKGARRRAPG